MTSVQTPTTSQSSHDFQALDLAFLGSLLPGIIHNWATPLSGVIGATQLLEKRASTIEELLGNFDQLTDAERGELQKQLDRNRTNVEILSRNAQHLADLLQILVYRITRGSSTARDLFPLHELMQNELRFLEANLQFKHKVRKHVHLSPVVPATAFAYGYVASAIDELITFAIEEHDHAQGILEMDFATGDESGEATLRVEARVSPSDPSRSNRDPLEIYLGRLQEDGWSVVFARDSGFMRLSLTRPLRQTFA